ncbi:MAG TPA: hypothetical protein VEL76_04245 [Gemmataceae bacterium]|nr:hypothetical protein [Gemmataceae bacterium]
MPQEARLALPAQPVEGGHHFVQHLTDGQHFAVGRGGDGVVQVEDVHPLHPQPPQACLQRRGHGVADAAEIGGRQPHLGADDRVHGLQLPERAAEISFRLAVAVLHRRIEVVHPGFQRPGDGPFLVGGVAAHHQPAHRTAAEAQDRDPHPAPAEGPHLHCHSLPLTRPRMKLGSQRFMTSHTGSPLGLEPKTTDEPPSGKAALWPHTQTTSSPFERTCSDAK